VDESEAPVRVEVRVRVLVGRLSVGSPPRVADSESSGRRSFSHQFSERCDPPGALAGFYLVAVDDRDPGGVIAAIFKPAQTIEKDGRSFRSTDVTDNATHKGKRDINEGQAQQIAAAGNAAKRLMAVAAFCVN
jgi:hypothetical protein